MNLLSLYSSLCYLQGISSLKQQLEADIDLAEAQPSYHQLEAAFDELKLHRKMVTSLESKLDLVSQQATADSTQSQV